MEQLIFFLLFSFFSTTSEDKIKGLADTQSQYSTSIGYTDYPSYQLGDTINLYMSFDTIKYEPVVICNILGDTVFISDTITKDIQIITNEDPWKNGYGYEITTSIPSVLLGDGVFFADDIPIIISDSLSENKITVLIPTATMAAYTISGGKSFYQNLLNDNSIPCAQNLSFLRPYRKKNFEVLPVKPFLVWLSKEYTNINFISDYDMHSGFNLDKTNLFIITGHSEFWSFEQRLFFDDYISDKKNALILSGNTMWKQVRYTNDGKNIHSYWPHHIPNDGNPFGKVNAFATPSSEFPIEPSIGSDFWNGGYGDVNDNGWDGFKVIKENSILFNETGLENGDIISLKNRELDGRPIKGLNDNGIPIWDYSSVVERCGKIETIAYDRGNWTLSGDLEETFLGIVVYQKNIHSGKIINTGSMNWCYENGINGVDSFLIRQMSMNMINLLLSNEDIFTQNNYFPHEEIAFGNESVISCDSINWNGKTYTESGFYSYLTTNSVGCDSVVTLDLTINNSNFGIDTQVHCNSYTWIDGVTYTSSNNTATWTLTNVAGCDSVVTLDLTIKPSPEQLIINQYWPTTFNSGESYAYQWYLNGEVLENDTTELLNFIQGGSYTVEAINSFGCKTMSEAFVIGEIERNFDAEIDFMVYPNPAQNLVFIELMEEFGTDGKIIVSDLVGQILKIIELKESFSSVIDFSIFKNGQYVIKVKYSNGIELSKTIIKN